MGIDLLGPLRIDGSDTSLQRRDQVVLAALAARRGEVLSADQLAEALWDEAPPSSWPKQIQGSVLRLRRVLGSSAIETTTAGYRLAVPGDDLDIRRFEDMIAKADGLADDGEFDRAAVVFGRALELWRGPPFDALDSWGPGQIEAARLAELRHTAEESVLDARLRAGEHREVVAVAEARVAEQPLREHRWALLAMALYRCGRQADSLRALRQARHTLREQLGIEPGPALVALEAAILRQDEDLLAVPAAPTVSTHCPYKGLAAYDVDDTDSFFGREDEVAACVQRLGAHPLLVVTGPSGCGKSSLVRAGLIPALRRAGRAVTVFMPGTDPLAAMTTAVAATDEAAPVMVVDQLEELFTLGDTDPSRVQAFCARLAAYAVETAPVVVVVRADYLAALSADTGFARLAEHGIHLVTPLAGDSLRAAIEGPAALAGLRLEQGLVDLLVRDCEGAPGALPLLSHALAETWQRRDGRVLTVEGYRATGEIRGAVARSADRVYESLPVEQRSKLRSVMLRMVSASVDGEPVRSRVSTRALGGDSDRERVIALLVSARLVTTEQDTVELAHEALARAWPRLRSWLDEDAAGQRMLRHLSAAAEGWESLGRPASELYRGARLDAALEWREAASPDLTELESAFLDASVAQAATEREVLAEHARRQARQNRRLRRALAAIAVLLVVALVGGFVAVDQREAAVRERRASTARELAAAADASLIEDPERSVLLALAAVDETRSDDGSVLPEAEGALHRAVSDLRLVLSVPGVGGSLAWSPAGDVFVTEGPEESGIIDIRDAETGASVRSWHGHDTDVNDVSFSADGSMLATAADDETARVWDPTTGEELWAFAVPGGKGPWAPTFSPDGSRLAASWYDRDLVRVFDLATGEVVVEIDAANVFDLAFSPDGTKLVMGNEEEPIAIVVDSRSGRQLFTVGADEGAIREVSWSSDGEAIATTGRDGTAHVWDAATGEHRLALAGHSAPVNSLDWSPDGRRLATVSTDGTARVWEILTGGARQLLTLSGQDTHNGLQDVAFSPDGDRLMTSDFGVSAVSVWDVSATGGGEWASLPAVPALTSHKVVSFTADGRDVAVSTEGGIVTLSDTETGEKRAAFEPSPGVEDDFWLVHVSPDGQLVAAAGFDAPLTVWDMSTGAQVFTSPGDGPESFTWDLSWSPDSRLLALLQYHDNYVAIVDRSGNEVGIVREDPEFQITSVSFSHDGRLVALARTVADRQDPTRTDVRIWDWERGEVVRTIDTPAARAVFDPTGPRLGINRWTDGGGEIWDTSTGDLIATLSGHASTIADVAFSQDGSRVVTAGKDGTVRVWDPRTGRQQLVLAGTDGEVGTAMFSPDGSKLASAGTDGLVRIWAVALDDLISIAEQRLTRTLTDDECRQYLHAARCPDTPA